MMKTRKTTRRPLRAVFDNTSNTYHTLPQKAKLTTLYNRRLQNILILRFKVKNGITPK